MSKKVELKPLAAAVGAALATSVFALPEVNAGQNPFEITALSSGYMVADAEGKCGEGEAAEDKDAEGKCGEGKCGEGEAAEDKDAEGKCGEGKCGEK